jgi:hypothetical protein
LQAGRSLKNANPYTNMKRNKNNSKALDVLRNRAETDVGCQLIADN